VVYTEPVIGFIRRTTQTLDVMVYSLTHPVIAQELLSLHQRGVRVRVVVDRLQASSRYSKADLIGYAGIEVRIEKQQGAMHHKVAICDIDVRGKNAVLSGSFNWTISAAERNEENAIIIRNKSDCLKAQEEFDRLWELNA